MKSYLFIIFFFLIVLSAACCNSTISVGSHTVSGSVTFCNTPYEGATVTISNKRMGSISCTSDEDGIYTFEDIWDGDYTVSFYSPVVEFYPECFDLAVAGSDTQAAEVIVVKSWKQSWGAVQDERISSVLQTSDYGFLVSGDEGSSNLKAVLMKYDRDGNLEWKYSYSEDEYSSILTGIAETSGGYVAAGSCYSTGDLSNGICLYFDKSSSISGSTASPAWRYEGSDLYYDAIDSLASDTDGNLLLGGSEGKEAGSQNDFYLRLFDSSGTLSAERRISSDAGTENSIRATVQNNATLYLLGSSNNGTNVTTLLFKTDNTLLGEISSSLYSSDELSVTGESLTISPSGKYLYALFSVKEDVAGNAYGRLCRFNINKWEWEDSAELGADFSFNCMAQCSDGGIIVGGSFASDDDGRSIAMIARYDANLRLQYSRLFEGYYQGMDAVYSIKQTHDGGFIAGGRISDAENCGHEYLLLKLNRDGEIYAQ